MTVEKEGRLRPRLVLAGLVAVSTAGRAVAGLHVDGLWIAPDEMIYGALGRSLWQDGDLEVFGGPSRLFGVVYPALAGLPLTLGGLDAGYEALKVVQAFVMSLTAVPVYLWSRRLAGAGWALVAAALALAIPGLLYSALIMSEVAFYPAMVLAAWATAAALERPTRRRQALLVAAYVLAAATRLQALVLPLVLVTAIGLAAGFERDLRRPLRLWPAVAALAALAAAWAGWRAAAGESVLGAYGDVSGAPYHAADVARFTLYHVAGLVLVSALFPACAVALLFARREASRPLRAYFATTLAFVVWLVVEIGAFASVYIPRLAERYVMPLVPLLFVGFAAWLARGGPRPRVTSGLAVLAALALVLAVPLREVIVEEAIPDSFTLTPLFWLRERAGEADLELAVWVGAAAALAAFALVPRRALGVLPALAFVALGFASAAATREVAQDVGSDRQHLVGGEPRWVDHRANQPVAYLYVGELLNIPWHQLFWNERIDRLYVLGAPVRDLPVETPVRIRPDGSFVPSVTERLVVALDAVTPVGAPLARVDLATGDATGLVLWRLDPPARLSSIRTGVRGEGDMYEPGRLTAWDCQSGALELTLLPKAASRVDLRVNGRTVQTLRFAGEEFVNATIHPPPGADICHFEVVPDGLLGSTRFEFLRR